MADFEKQNLAAIEALNQRGGRLLSLVDLLEAGTVNLEIAAELAWVAVRGGSFLTAAGPGGVGKTALMASMLTFLTPNTEILTIENAAMLMRLPLPQPGTRQCLLAHEIGSGSWLGYLWGPAVSRFFNAAMISGRSLASNLHAETYPVAVGLLTRRPLGVTGAAIGSLDLIPFIGADGEKRRITELWETDGTAKHRLQWQWKRAEDRFEQVGPSGAAAAFAAKRGMRPEAVEQDLAAIRGFLNRALADGTRSLEALRQRAIRELFRNP